MLDIATQIPSPSPYPLVHDSLKWRFHVDSFGSSSSRILDDIGEGWYLWVIIRNLVKKSKWGPDWLVPVSVKKLAEECYCQTEK